jgi:hypothetical protein
MVSQVENLNVAFPDRFAGKVFFHRHRFNPSRAGLVRTPERGVPTIENNRIWSFEAPQLPADLPIASLPGQF